MPKILICNCPDFCFDGQELAARLQQAGVAMEAAPPLCTPGGLQRLRALATADPGGWLLGACGPEVNAGLFRLLEGTPPLPVVDLLACPDAATAAGALLLALEGASEPELPAPAPAPSREVLVVGGGVGGCQAALDLANAGF